MKVTDIKEFVLTQKCKWAEQITRLGDNRCPDTIGVRGPRQGKRHWDDTARAGWTWVHTKRTGGRRDAK